MFATVRKRLNMIEKALPLKKDEKGFWRKSWTESWNGVADSCEIASKPLTCPSVMDDLFARVQRFVRSTLFVAVPLGLAFAGWSGRDECRCAIRICS